MFDKSATDNGFFNKISNLDVTLGGTHFRTIIVVNLVALGSAVKV